MYVKHQDLCFELTGISSDDGMFMLFELFDNLDESISFLEVLFFGKILGSSCKFVDSFAVVEIEPKFNIVFIAEKIRFRFSQVIDLISGKLGKQFLLETIGLISLSGLFFVSNQKLSNKFWTEVIQYTTSLQ